jgi:hypothetical protein
VRRFLLTMFVCGLVGPATVHPSFAAAVPGALQESPRLTWLTPGFLPEQGLLTIGLRGSRYHPGYNPTGGPAHYDVVQGSLFADWSLRSWLSISVSQGWRAWSNYLAGGQTHSGSGVPDGSFKLALAAPRLPPWLGLGIWGGGNLPSGSGDLTEDAFSPQAGASLSLAFWRGSRYPEMRLHLSGGRRWNGNDGEGYGAAAGPNPQPWFPLYPSDAAAGGEGRNDFLFWAVAIEFRRAASALWVEWSVFRLDRALNVSMRENQQILAAGLRWGLREGWALHGDYQVGFHLDDLENPDWYPRLPHIGFTFAVSRQFAVRWP